MEQLTRILIAGCLAILLSTPLGAQSAPPVAPAQPAALDTAAARRIMWTPFKDGYAYGWSIAEPSAATFGHKRVAHGGGINGFSSMIIRVPDTNVTAIVLTNNTSAPASPIARDLLAIYYGQPYSVPAPRTVAQVDPKVLDQYVGKYDFRPDFIMTVTREGSTLFAPAAGQKVIEIFPMFRRTLWNLVL